MKQQHWKTSCLRMQVSAFLYLNHMQRFPKFIKASLFVNNTVTMITKTRKKSYIGHDRRLYTLADYCFYLSHNITAYFNKRLFETSIAHKS